MAKQQDYKKMSWEQAQQVMKAHNTMQEQAKANGQDRVTKLLGEIRSTARALRHELSDSPDSVYSNWLLREEKHLHKANRKYKLGSDMNVIRIEPHCPFDLDKARNTVELALRLTDKASMSQLRRMRMRLITIKQQVEKLELAHNIGYINNAAVHVWKMNS